MCGCGKSAPIATQTFSNRGLRKGEYLRYISGHNRRGKFLVSVPPPNPSGLCLCGCGQQTNLAPQNDTKAGLAKGQPLRYVVGHGPGRKPRLRRTLSCCKCGCGELVQSEWVLGHHRRKDTVAAFWSRVRKTPTCWYWTGPLDKDGYGHCNAIVGTPRAHRTAYILTYGSIPEGKVLDHLCEERSCVNPSHIKATTSADNVLRSARAVAAINARKTHCIRGHEFTPENTYRWPKRPRSRQCKRCNADRQRQANRGDDLSRIL